MPGKPYLVSPTSRPSLGSYIEMPRHIARRVGILLQRVGGGFLGWSMVTRAARSPGGWSEANPNSFA